MCILLVFVVVLLLSSTATMYTRRLFSDKFMYPDVYAWVGGYITGLFGAMWMLPSVENPHAKRSGREQCFFVFGIFATIALLVTYVVVFATYSVSTKYWYLSG